MTLSIRANVRPATDRIGKITELFRRPFAGPRGRRQARALRSVIRKEATGGRGFGPSGPVNWQPVLPFGSRPATNPPLGGPSSTYWRAWLAGPGSALQIRAKSVTIENRLHWAHVHRGGRRIPARRITVIRAKKISSDGRFAMGHALRGLYGVHLREETLRRGLRVPSRPNVDPRAPEYQRAVVGQFEVEVGEALS